MIFEIFCYGFDILVWDQFGIYYVGVCSYFCKVGLIWLFGVVLKDIFFLIFVDYFDNLGLIFQI